MIKRRLREIREDLGFTRQDEFAKSLDLKFRTYQTYEQGQVQVIPHTLLIKLRTIYGVSIDWLLLGIGEKYINIKESEVNIKNHNGNVAVNGSTITINKNDYMDSEDIKELLEVLKNVPKSWVGSVTKKLKNALDAIDKEF